MKICPMTEADCEKTGLLMKECFSVPWSVEGLKEMFHTEGYCSFLAKEEEEVIGYVGMKMVLDEAVQEMCNLSKALVEQGIKQGIKQGIELGKEERTLSMAQMMIQEREPIEKIEKYTGYTLEKLREIATKIGIPLMTE